MKRILFICLLQLLVYAAYGQFTISGKIIDETGNPLPGANIILENTYHGTSTDLKGNFVFSKIRKGEYVLKITYIGYASVNKKVKVDANVYLDIFLEPAMILGDEVVVTATRAKDKMPIAHINLSQYELERRNLGQDIPFILDQTPSIVSSSDAGTGIGYTSLRIRGTDANRINVTINGIPLNDAESHGVFWVDLPDLASSLENIQIQRGVGTSTNGAGAFGATINLQTTRLNLQPYAELNSSYGSFNTFKGNVKFGTGLIKNKFTFDGRISRIYSDGFIDRAFANLKSFYLSGGIYNPKSFLRFNVISGWEETYQAWYGSPKAALDTNRTYNPYTYENEIDHYEQAHYQLIYSKEFSKKLILNFALHYTRGKGYFEQLQEARNYYHQTSFAHYGLENVILGNDTVTNTDLIRRLWLDNHFYGITYSLSYRKNKFDFILGGAWNNYIGDHFGRLIWARYASNSNIRKEWYNNNGEKQDFNFYGKLNLRLTNSINLFADMQFRRISFKVDGNENGLNDIGLSPEFNFLNPKVGIFYKPREDQNIYFSVAIGNREPNRDNFVDAKAAGLTEPTAETLIDYELGYQYKNPRISMAANLYYMDYNNQLVTTGEINYVGMPIMTNVPESYRAGIEIEVNVNPVSNIQWSLNTTLSRNKIKDFYEKIELYDDMTNWTFLGHKSQNLGETDLSFSPGIIINSYLAYEVVKNLSIEWISKYVGDQYIENTSNPDRKLDAYFLNNTIVSYNFKSKLINEAKVRFMVNNIFNHEYETNAWVYRATFNDGSEFADFGYFPQAGINYLLGLSVKF